MATTTIPSLSTAVLPDAWQAANRFTAAADTDVILSNPSSDIVYFALTTSDTPPAASPRRTNPLKPNERQPMVLASGERLWVAGYGAYAAIEV